MKRTDEMAIEDGGWTLGPVEKVDLPLVRLTAAQKRANTAARAKYKRVCAQLDAIYKKAEALGGYTPDDGYPELVLPHDPNAYDVARFTPKQKAYYAWLTTSRWSPGRESALRDLVNQDFKLSYAFTGGSIGRWPIPADQWPQLPEWAKRVTK